MIKITAPFSNTIGLYKTSPIKQNAFQKSYLQEPQKDVFVKTQPKQAAQTKSYTNEDALELMRKELKDAMSEKELDTYMTKLQESCKKLKIEPKDLPINEEHPGNLTEEQKAQLFSQTMTDVMF